MTLAFHAAEAILGPMLATIARNCCDSSDILCQQKVTKSLTQVGCVGGTAASFSPFGNEACCQPLNQGTVNM